MGAGPLGSGLTGLGNVPTAGQPDQAGNGAGGAVLTDVTSADHSVIVTSPSAHVRDLSYNGVYQLIDSYGVVNDAPAINTALTALAARPHNNGVLEIPAGTHRLKSAVTVPTGCSLDGAGKNATLLLVDESGGAVGDAIRLTNNWASSVRNLRMDATVPRTAGAMISIKGGNTGIQPFFGAGGYTLSACEVEVDQVDMNNVFDGIVLQNNGAASIWLVYVRNCRIGNLNGGDGIRVDAPGTITGTDYGASFFFDRVFVTGIAAAPTGNGLHMRGAGDFTVNGLQVSLTSIGCLIDPPANGRMSTGRFTACQLDSAGQYCLQILPTAGAVFFDLSFVNGWFAGAGVHNVLVNGAVAKSLRFIGNMFFFAQQYGMVLTGSAPGPTHVIVQGNQFSGAGTGGFRAVLAQYFDVSHNQFYGSDVPPIAAMPTAVQLDAGCSDFIVRNNIWTQATTGLVDSTGNVAKSIGGNIATNTVALNMVAVLSATVGSAEGAATAYMANDADLGGGSITTPFDYPTSARIIQRLWLSAPAGGLTVTVTATLMKNGVATAMTCTMAAGAPAGTVVFDVVHPVTFAATDVFDVRLTTPAAAAAPGPFTVTLEGPEPGP